MFPLAYRLAECLALASPSPANNIVTSLAGRRTAGARWIDWASRNRTGSPLVWVHGASVGECLAAVGVVDRLRAAIPGLQVVHSYTSPSMGSWKDQIGSDRVDYLPADEPAAVTPVLEFVRPDLFAFSRGDLWPTVVNELRKRRVPIAVLGGIVGKSSRRLWPLIRHVLIGTYAQIDWLGAVTQADKVRWNTLGVQAHKSEVTGDPRHDYVLERSFNSAGVRDLVEWTKRDSTLVAGSTDNADEQVVLDAFAMTRRSSESAVKLIVAPHDVGEKDIERVLASAKGRGIDAATWESGKPDQNSSCLVVTTTGMLADLYAVGDIAYVGGGFGNAGLHAVIEPAAYALPVVVGPGFRDSQDFYLMLEAGGGVALPRTNAAEALQQIWLAWSDRESERVDVGVRARRVLHEGAADRTAQALIRLLHTNELGSVSFK